MQNIQADQIPHILESAAFAAKAIGWVIGTAIPALLVAVIFIIRLEGKVNALKDKDLAQGEEIKALREKVYEPLIKLIENFKNFEENMKNRFDGLERSISDLQNEKNHRRTAP